MSKEIGSGLDLRNLLESGWQDRRATPTAAEAPRARIGTPWDHALSAPEFLAGDETEAPFLVPRLLARGAITEVFSPRGLGKTNVVHAHLVELARAGLRVLLIDRDNPRREIKRRLRAWHADVAPSLKIIGREHAPPLTDTEAWAAFPMDTYDVVAIDSLDASAEGVGEGDSAKPSRAFAVVLDLARRRDGPAIIVLGNVIKSGAHSRGSGVIEDRADISYEVRDATGLRPSGTRDWWHELPPSSVADWALRASRRTRRDVYRLAFVPSKFRLGEEPEPFVFEVDHRPDPWALRDVTRDLLAAGEAARTQAEHHRAETLAAATERLADEIASREDTGEPMILGNAEAFLRAAGLTRKAARDLLAAEDGRRWSRVPGAGKGAPVHFRRGPLFSSGKTSRTSAAKIPGENPTPTTQNPERPIYADRMDTGRRKSPPHQTRINGGDSTPPISPAAGISLPPAEDTDSTAEMPNTGPEDDEEIAL